MINMSKLNPYLKLLGPILLTLVGSLATVYGNYPWYTPVASAITALLVYFIPNMTSTVTKATVVAPKASQQ